MKTLNGFILVKLIEATQSPGGILLVDSSKPLKKGKVLSVGQGAYFRSGIENPQEMVVNEGDTVYFNAGNCLEVNHNAKEYLIHHDHLLAVEE